MTQELTVEVVAGIAAIDPVEWDACAGDDPFLQHAHLFALETTGCACAETGFRPTHIVLRDGQGRIAAAAPTYLKWNSDAEIGADMGWSLAHDRLVGPYYPKLQVEVPFSTFPGSRLLTAPGTGREGRQRRLLEEIIGLASRHEVSSAHINFMTAEEQALAIEAGMQPDRGTRFVWENWGYAGFDQFLGSLRSHNRNKMKRERRTGAKEGIVWECHSGHTLSPSLVSFLHEFYQNTYQKYRQRPFLTARYFQEIARTMADDLLVVLARDAAGYMAGCISFHNAHSIFVQHWGSIRETSYLHFETTYYQAIEFALSHGQRWVDASVNGLHKVERGFLPVDDHHAHWFRDQAFHKLIAGGIAKKSRAIEGERTELLKRFPFRDRGGAAHD